MGYSPTAYTPGVPAFGTLQTQDTLQSLRVAQGTVASFGEDNVFEVINNAFTAHNRILAELLSAFCEVTTNRLRRTGGNGQMEMEEIDAWGDVQPQKEPNGANIGFPLRKFGAGLQWNRDFFENCTVQEFAAQVTMLLTADVRRIRRQITRAFYGGVNYTFYDRILDNAVLPVKALQNNDTSFPIPVGPNGEVFPSNMNHYHVASVCDQTAVEVLRLEVIEHHNTGDTYIIINQAQEGAFRGMPNTVFVPLLPAQIIGSTLINQAAGMSLDVSNPYDRCIGYFNGCEVWVKPWAPVNYLLCYQLGQRKPLALRVRGTGPEGVGGSSNSIMGGSVGVGNGDLRLMYEYDEYPLRARGYVREFDVAVQNRIGAAVLQITNNGSYTPPYII